MIAEIRRMWSSIRHVAVRGRLTLINNKKSIQIQQNELFTGQIKSDIPSPQQYGFESAPFVGADTINLNRGGSLESGWVVMTYDGRYKPLDLEDGDSIQYTARNVDSKIKASGIISLTGELGAEVPIGTTVSRDSDGALYESVSVAKVGEDGLAHTQFNAVEAGEIGNAEPLAPCVLTSVVEGIGAVKARGTIEFTGIDGAPIPQYTLVKAGAIYYVATSSGTVSGGVASVPFEALLAGALGNQSADTPVVPETPLIGITTSLIGTMEGGLDEEVLIEIMHGGRDESVHRIWMKEEDGEILIETDSKAKIVCRDAEVEVSNNLTATVVNKTTLTTNIADINATTSATVDCPTTTWTGDITLNGNINQTGGITSTEDHVADGISLTGHDHAGDGGTGSGPSTGPPR
jgi:phage gp45-like